MNETGFLPYINVVLFQNNNSRRNGPPPPPPTYLAPVWYYVPGAAPVSPVPPPPGFEHELVYHQLQPLKIPRTHGEYQGVWEYQDLYHRVHLTRRGPQPPGNTRRRRRQPFPS